jgi:hypothetical protein
MTMPPLTTSTSPWSTCGRSVVLAMITLASTGCGTSGGSAGQADIGAQMPTTPAIATSIHADDINRLRAQCGGPVALGQLNVNTSASRAMAQVAVTTAATSHAGWQAINDANDPTDAPSLSHTELPPPPSNALYVDGDFATRINIAYLPSNAGKPSTAPPPTGQSWIPHSSIYYEDISSQANTIAIADLWNTVYHRLPMMRHQVGTVGYGDQIQASGAFPAAQVPSTNLWHNSPTNNGYATLDFVGYAAVAITLSYWPSDGTVRVPTTFFADNEEPDPITANGFPSHPSDHNAIGPPLHVILPSTLDILALTVTFTRAASSVPIPVFALVGGNNLPTVNQTTVTQVQIDATGNINPGEIFILPSAPLQANTTYSYSVTATDISGSYSTPILQFTTVGP